MKALGGFIYAVLYFLFFLVVMFLPMAVLFYVLGLLR